MLQRGAIEAVMMEIAHQQGQSLNGGDRLAIRTGVARSSASTMLTKVNVKSFLDAMNKVALSDAIMTREEALERHKRRMTAPAYQWAKPAPKR